MCIPESGLSSRLKEGDGKSRFWHRRVLEETIMLRAGLAMIPGTVGTFLFSFLGPSEMLLWLPGSWTNSGRAYGVIGPAVAGIAAGIAAGIGRHRLRQVAE